VGPIIDLDTAVARRKKIPALDGNRTPVVQPLYRLSYPGNNLVNDVYPYVCCSVPGINCDSHCILHPGLPTLGFVGDLLPKAPRQVGPGEGEETDRVGRPYSKSVACIHRDASWNVDLEDHSRQIKGE